ncbi:glycosyltransferase family 2 protein [Kaistella palustris]|uniref:glycosyltransferase family 2 protein n=1 Tax=Kaistella palustris TaxID=493376 RepID=UPI000426EC9B|nr:glycosyltransferase family 2 protein [Kaistella palustris]
MTRHPLISLIIITMNHEKFIAQAVDSALAQTYPNFEIVLLDNKSDDRTLSVAKSVLKNSDIPHRIIENTERFGVAKNLNILVSNAGGEYVSILSGDDWLAEESLTEKLEFLEKNKLDFILADGYRYLQDENKLVDAYTDKQKNRIMRTIDNFFYENVTGNQPFNVGVFVKRELLVNYPFDEEIHAEDWDMNLRLTSLGFKVGFLNKKLFYYRILSGSLSKNWKLMEISFRKITSKYMDDIRADKNLLKKYKINALRHKYEILLAETTSKTERKTLQKSWKTEKYKIKYKHPVLFFKLLLLR